MRWLLLFCLIPQFAFSKTLIFTTAFNRPDFIQWQHKLFNKFMLDDYEYIVFSDANTQQMQAEIQEMCDELGIACIPVPQEIHTRPYLVRRKNDNLHQPNIRNCNAVQWAWDNYLVKHNGPVLLVDSDMFLIRPLSLEDLFKECDLAYVPWGTEDPRTHRGYSYMWIALIAFNLRTLPSPETICFNCGIIPNTSAIVDSGGWTYFYLQKYQHLLKTQLIPWIQGHEFYCPYRYTDRKPKSAPHEVMIDDLTNRGFTPQEIELVLEKPDTIELLWNNHFLHYRCGTNYEKYSTQHLDKKDRAVLSFFNKILLGE